MKDTYVNTLFRWKCGAIFASYGGRMKHEKAQHSENPYKLKCDICGRPFRYTILGFQLVFGAFLKIPVEY